MAKMKKNPYSSPMKPAYAAPKIGSLAPMDTKPSARIDSHNQWSGGKGKKVPMDSPLKNTFRTLP